MESRHRRISSCVLAAFLLLASCTGPDEGDPRTGTYHGWLSLGNDNSGSATLVVAEDGTADLECDFTGEDPFQGTFHLRLTGSPYIDSHGNLTGSDLLLTRIVPGVDTTSGQAAIYGTFHMGLDYFNGEWSAMPGEEASGSGFWFASKNYRP